MTADKPKCLLPLNGITILDYQIKSLEKAKVDKILIVTGFKSEMIEEHVVHNKLIAIVKNNEYETTDNAYSLSLALNEVDPKKDSVIVLDGDIIFDPELLLNLADSKHQNVTIADNSKAITDEDCKVNIKDGYAIGIGKKVEGQAVYTSMIKMGGQFLNSFKREIKKKHSLPEWYSEPLHRLLVQQDSQGKNEMSVIYSGDLDRCEIDTPDDYQYARKIYERIIEKYSGGYFQ